MLQRSSLPSTSTAEIADTLQRSLRQRTWDSGRWRSLQNLLPMPATWQQYLLACLALAVIFGGLLLHVLLSVQIARADFQLRQMSEEYARVERQNSELVYQIAQRSSLVQMAALAAQQGYAPATGRTYALRNASAVQGDVSPQAVNVDQTTAPGQRSAASATPPAWHEQIGRWWQDTQQAAAVAASQLWRDITGRAE